MDNCTENNKEEHQTGRVPLFSGSDLILAILGLIFCLTFFVMPTISDNRKALLAAADIAKPDPFSLLDLKAEAAYVLDVKNNQVLFEKNSEAALPLASITKIMTAVAALRSVPESTIITIHKADLELEGDSGLYADEKWDLGDLLALTLIESSNDGAYAAASSVGEIEGGTADKQAGRTAFLNLMNQTAKELGLSQTYFSNPTGLDESPGIAGAYGSARDIAHLIAYAALNYPDVFSTTRYNSLKFQSLSDLKHTAVNTNKELGSIPMILASKTGFTDLAGGNLAVVFSAGIDRPIAVVVLHSTETGRFEDVKNLAWTALDYLSSEKKQ